MRRGFKAEAKAIAREVRDEMSLAPTSCLDPWRLAEHLCIPVIPMSSFIAAEPDAVRFYQNEGEAMFSGATVFRESRRTVVFNDAHAPGRQANDIVHELGHGLLGHSPTVALDELGMSPMGSVTSRLRRTGSAECSWCRTKRHCSS